MPLENGVPKRPFRPQAHAADTTVFTGHIPIRRGRRLSIIKTERSDVVSKKNPLFAYIPHNANVPSEGTHPKFI